MNVSQAVHQMLLLAYLTRVWCLGLGSAGSTQTGWLGNTEAWTAWDLSRTGPGKTWNPWENGCVLMVPEKGTALPTPPRNQPQISELQNHKGMDTSVLHSSLQPLVLGRTTLLLDALLSVYNECLCRMWQHEMLKTVTGNIKQVNREG